MENSNLIRTNYGKVFIRPNTANQKTALGNIIDDATGWISNQKEEGTTWLKENTGDVVTELVQKSANDLVDLGKNTVVDKVKEIISGPSQTQVQTTVPQTQTVTTTIPQSQSVTTNSGDQNFIQKVNPGITFLIAGTITALITRNVKWTLAAASAGAIAHHAYRVNRK